MGDHSRYNSMRKSFLLHLTKCLILVILIDKSFTSGGPGEGAFQLPSIGKGSPFKGFLDISIVTQKMRKNMHSQDGTATGGHAPFEFGAALPGGRRGYSKPTKADATILEKADGSKIEPKKTRFQSKDRQV